MAKYALVVNGLIDSIAFSPDPGYVLVPDNAFPGDAFYGTPPVLIPNPGQFWMWSGTEFVFDEVSFHPYFEEQIALYRDQMSSVNVSFDNGTEEFTVLNDERTRAALQQKMASLELRPASTVNFETYGGYYDLTLVDVSGLFQACDDRQQACFDATKVIKDNHETTPYTNMQDAYNDFDAELA